jgi:phytanoyl-CoA hydroxylase
VQGPELAAERRTVASTKEDVMSLTAQDVWYFHHNGFVVPAGRIPDELLGRANAQTDHEVAERIDPIVWAKDARDPTERVLMRLSKILQRSPVYYEVATQPVLLDALEAILGPNVELLTNKHNHLMVKPPGAPPVSWHYGEPFSQPRLITAIVPLGDTTLDNGCLRFVPGSHVNPLEPDPHRTDAARMRRVNELPFHETDLYRLSVPVPLKRGQFVLFDDSIWHGSDINRSDADRRSMTLAYVAHVLHATQKDDPEQLLVRGRRAYSGHALPGPEWRWPRPPQPGTATEPATGSRTAM